MSLPAVDGVSRERSETRILLLIVWAATVVSTL